MVASLAFELDGVGVGASSQPAAVGPFVAVVAHFERCVSFFGGAASASL